MHAAGKHDSEGGEERGEKESSKAERLLGLGHRWRRVWGWPGKRLERSHFKGINVESAGFTCAGNFVRELSLEIVSFNGDS